MNSSWIRNLALFALGGTFVFAGCKSNAPATPAAPVRNADGSVTNPNGSVTVPNNAPAGAAQPMAIRNPDGSITNPDGSVTYPAGSKVAAKENAPNGSGMTPRTDTVPLRERPLEPATESATRTLAPATVVSHSVPAGTAVRVRLNGGLAASRNEVGDRFSGVLEGPLTANGATVFPSGTPVSGEVVASKGKGRFKGAGDLGIALTAIGRDRVSTTSYEVASKGRGKRTAGFAGGGAGLGALIGGLAGGGKGALIGGLAGAGAGTAAGAYTGNRDVVIPSESIVTFRLTQSLTR